MMLYIDRQILISKRGVAEDDNKVNSITRDITC